MNAKLHSTLASVPDRPKALCAHGGLGGESVTRGSWATLGWLGLALWRRPPRNQTGAAEPNRGPLRKVSPREGKVSGVGLPLGLGCRSFTHGPGTGQGGGGGPPDKNANYIQSNHSS